MLWVVVYASAVGLSSSEGTAILALTNFATTVGQIGMGHLADKADSQLLMTGSSFLSALVVFVFWGLGQTLIRLLSFGILFGLFSGGFSVLYTRFATALAADRTTQTWLYTIFDVQRGVMVIIGGAIGGTLAHGPVNTREYGLGEYKDLVIFSGVCFAVSALGIFGFPFREKSFRLPQWWKRKKTRVQKSPSMEQLLSTIEHHIWLDTEKGLIDPDDSTHQRYIQSIRQAIQGHRTISVAMSQSSSRSSSYSTDFPSTATTLTPFPLQISRPGVAEGGRNVTV